MTTLLHQVIQHIYLSFAIFYAIVGYFIINIKDNNSEVDILGYKFFQMGAKSNSIIKLRLYFIFFGITTTNYILTYYCCRGDINEKCITDIFNILPIFISTIYLSPVVGFIICGCFSCILVPKIEEML